MNESKIDGNYIALKDEAMSGMITGNVIVKKGINFTNHGMLCKDVVVEENARFYNY